MHGSTARSQPVGEGGQGLAVTSALGATAWNGAGRDACPRPAEEAARHTCQPRVAAYLKERDARPRQVEDAVNVQPPASARSRGVHRLAAQTDRASGTTRVCARAHMILSQAASGNVAIGAPQVAPALFTKTCNLSSSCISLSTSSTQACAPVVSALRTTRDEVRAAPCPSTSQLAEPRIFLGRPYSAASRHSACRAVLDGQLGPAQRAKNCLALVSLPGYNVHCRAVGHKALRDHQPDPT